VRRPFIERLEVSMPIARLALALVMMLAAACLGPIQAQDGAVLGATVESVTPAMMAKEGLAVPFGARVTAVEPASPADAAGLAQGDIIISVNGKGIDNEAEFAAAIAKSKPGETLDLMRFRGKEALASVKVKLASAEIAPGPVVATGPPRLMLNSGGHMSVINDVVFTADGKQLVSASDDKTIRIWDLATGKTVRMILGEAEPGSPGKVFAMALSPDGKVLAAGGKFHDTDPAAGSAIRLYDFASGELIGLLQGHTDVVLDLAFSPDSKYLISGSGDDSAIIWDVAKRSLKHRLEGHAGSIYAVTFTNDSARAVTSSFDRILRIWSVKDGSELAMRIGHEHKIRSLAIRPDGSIASGDEGGKIWLWDGMTGAYKEILAHQKTAVGSLTFSPDGKYLLAGAGYQGRGNDCHVYDATTGELVVTYTEHDNIVLATAISPDSRWAATGGGDAQEIRIWDLKSGKPRLRDDGKPLILKGAGEPAWAAAFSKDGRRIAWGSTWKAHTTQAKNPLEHALALPIGDQALGRPEPLKPEDASHFRRAEMKHGKLSLMHRRGGAHNFDAFLDISDADGVRASIKRGSTDGYQHRSYTFSPDGMLVVSAGDNGFLTEYDTGGNELGKFVGHTGDVWAATPSPDGRYLVSGSADQTVRLWNLKTRELIVTLFYGSDGEWVMWTPQGYYTGSPGGGELVGWQINQGAAKEARYIRGRQLRDKLLRPDIVERAITLVSAEAALEEAGMANVSVQTLLTHTLPVLSLEAAPEAAGGRTYVLVASEKNTLPILETRFTVSDGKQEKAVEAHVIALPPGTPQPETGATLRAYEVPLFKGANTVRVVAVNAAGESEPRQASINHNGEGALDKRGTLWVLAVGADKYPGGKKITDPETGDPYLFPDLKFAGADAKAFAEATVAHMKGRHTKTDVTVLINGGAGGEPTRANILHALSRIQDSSADTDTVVILLAGHGENWTGGRYHFLPTDFKRSSTTELGENVIDWKDDVQPAIAGAKGHKVLFLDACYSANAYNKTLLADADADRFVAFSAAAPGQKAWEFASEGHGAFTYMLIEALNGAQAALDPLEKGVTIYKLGDYVNLKVRERTFGKQTPEFRSGQGNFVLTRM
jgi:WD40 repeat protein